MFGRLQAFNTITGSQNYLMVVCGVFKEDTKTRGGSMGGGAAAGGGGGGRGGRGATPPLDEAGKQAVRDAWDQFMKPHPPRAGQTDPPHVGQPAHEPSSPPQRAVAMI